MVAAYPGSAGTLGNAPVAGTTGQFTGQVNAGNFFAGNGGVAGVQSATAVAVASSGTIATANLLVSRVSPAGAVTSVILAPGTMQGQILVVINEAVAANSVTFAAQGTSNVADGTSAVIAGLTQKTFVWDTATALWYHS